MGEDDLPQFVKIIKTLVISAFILLSIEVYITIGVNDYILGYLINRTNVYVVCLTYLFSFEVYYENTFMGDNSLYILCVLLLKILSNNSNNNKYSFKTTLVLLI